MKLFKNYNDQKEVPESNLRSKHTARCQRAKNLSSSPGCNNKCKANFAASKEWNCLDTKCNA